MVCCASPPRMILHRRPRQNRHDRRPFRSHTLQCFSDARSWDAPLDPGFPVTALRLRAAQRADSKMMAGPCTTFSTSGEQRRPRAMGIHHNVVVGLARHPLPELARHLPPSHRRRTVAFNQPRTVNTINTPLDGTVSKYVFRFFSFVDEELTSAVKLFSAEFRFDNLPSRAFHALVVILVLQQGEGGNRSFRSISE